MADMYGAVCSNDFQVRDVEAFKALFDEYSFGGDVEVWAEEGSDVVSFGGYEQYPDAFPVKREHEDECSSAVLPDRPCDCAYEEEDATQEFAAKVRELMKPGEILHVVAAGNEKLRYVGCTELIVGADFPEFVVGFYYSDQPKSELEKRLRVENAAAAA